jgi:hypothetical protein
MAEKKPKLSDKQIKKIQDRIKHLDQIDCQTETIPSESLTTIMVQPVVITSVFALRHDQSPELWNIKFYATQKLARAELRKIADDRKRMAGVTMAEQTPDKFSFYMGWEENKVSFSVVEVPVIS